MDWAAARLNIIFDKKQKTLNQKQQIEKRLQHGSQIMKKLQDDQANTDETLNQLTNKINILIDSDMDSIRAYITKEHHYYCYQRKWIDDFTLDCLQRRFQHYVDEGGNSFIGGFMNDLRDLPNQPPPEQ